MQIVLTVQLQQDNGTPVVTATQTRAGYTGGDIDLVRSFLTGPALFNFVRLAGWIADGRVSLSGTPTLTLAQLA